MPRYFFHIRDHDRLIVDEEGLEFPDMERARAEGEAGALDLLRDALLDGQDIGHQVIEITSSEGELLQKVHLCSFVDSIVASP